MFRMLSVLSITKVEMPKARQGRMTGASSFMSRSDSFNIVLEPRRKHSTHTALTAWLITVAMAAPRTPIPSTKIKMGSKMVLSTAPAVMQSMEYRGLPSALARVLRTLVRMKKGRPRAVMRAYSWA